MGQDSGNPLQDADLLDPTFLSLAVDGEALSVRQPLHRPVVATSVQGGSAAVTSVHATSVVQTPLLDADAVDVGSMTAQSIDSASLTTTDLTTQTLDVGQVFSAPGATFDDATTGALQATTIDTDVMSAQGGRLGSVTSDSAHTTEQLTNPAEVQYCADGVGPDDSPDFLLSGADLLPNLPGTDRISRWSSDCDIAPSQGAEFHVWWR